MFGLKWFAWQVSIVKWSYFTHLDTIRLKLSAYVYFMVLSHSMQSKYKNSINRFCDAITNVLYIDDNIKACLKGVE